MNKEKTCSKCGEIYPATIEFYRFRKDSSDGFRTNCRKCDRAYRKQYYIKNKNIISKHQREYKNRNVTKIARYQRKYRKNNNLFLKEYGEKYRRNNDLKIKEKKREYRNIYQDKIRKAKKSYSIKNRNRRNINERNRRKIELEYRIVQNLRSRLHVALKSQGSSKSATTKELLGCSMKQLVKHITSQFTENMSWNNYGKYGWHIDHIRPCVDFDLTKHYNQKKCFNYKNLRPLWCNDNLKKSSFYNGKLIKKRRRICHQL